MGKFGGEGRRGVLFTVATCSNYRPLQWPGSALGRVCVYVCVQTKTFKRNDL